jgi:dGTPase
MGLNLMYETRLGLARHRSPYDEVQAGRFDEQNCSLEGQVANVADRIAYNCHDLEDGMRAGLISREMLKDIKIFAEAEERINANAIDDRTIRRTRTAKAIMNTLVGDCLETSKTNLAGANVKTIQEIYAMSESIITLSADSDKELAELEGFMMQNLYLHPSLVETTGKVEGWLGSLFERLCQNPKRMPGYFQRFIPEHGLQRAVCDYIAGMTDRFCLKMLENV